MRKLLIAGFALLAACNKSVEKQAIYHPTEKETCSFGLTEFNLTKRAPVTYDEFAVRRKSKPGPTVPPATTASSVILLDFNGHVVSGTSWNSSGDINCSPANLTTEAVSEIVERVTNDYSEFNIIITTDEAVYNAANTLKRMRVVITESWEWFGQAGGVAFLNSFTWGDNTPCFVFSSLLSYSTKSIAEASSHEAGHTLGLRHQSSYDANGVKISEYNYGLGAGETGWAPIMGVGYYKNLTVWHNGPNSISSTTIQNDVTIITSLVGLKMDDYTNTTSQAVSLSSSLDGCINNSTDIDCFSVNLSAPKNVIVTPFNVGIGNSGANVDLLLKIYNSQGNLISTVDNPSTLNVTIALDAGTYYFSVSTIANQYAGTYGMLGKYNISLN